MVASRIACAFLLAIGWLYSACAAGDSQQSTGPALTIQRQGDRLTARIARAPLRLVLDELRRQAGIHGQLVDPTDEDTVSESFRDILLPEAIARLLNGRSFLIDHGTSAAALTTSPLRLLILPRMSVAPVATMSLERPSTTINDLTQAMVDPDERVRARAEEMFEHALVAPNLSAAETPQPPR